MSWFRTQPDYTKVGGIPSNTTWVGPWINCSRRHSLGWIVKVPGTTNPAAAFTVDVSNDPNADTKTDAQLIQTPTDFPLTAAQKTAANPAGAGVAISAIIQFERAGNGTVIPPMPRANWARLVYTVTSGGTTGKGVSISLSEQGV